MTHPTREEWMSYLYDEVPAKARAALDQHLHSCAECRTQLSTWRVATRELSDWNLPKRSRRSVLPALTRWAVAAAVVALAVVGAGRILMLEKQVKDLRAEVGRATQYDFDAAMAASSDRATKAAIAEAEALVNDLAHQWVEKRLEDQRSTLAALQRLTALNAQEYAKLRKELETVAVFSEAGWERAQSQISRLAVSPASFSDQQ